MATETSRMVGAHKADLDRGIERVSQSAHEAVDRAAAAASSAAERIGERAERLGEKGDELLALKDNWVEDARHYVRDNPLAALGMALAAGYLLHMVTRTR